nr:hypothetical protein [Myxococcota bacterium]
DDDESFDFDAVVAVLTNHDELDSGDGTLADLAFHPAHGEDADIDRAEIEPADLDREDVDREDIDHEDIDRADVDRADVEPADAGHADVLAQLLLGADPNDTLPGAPAPRD